MPSVWDKVAATQVLERNFEAELRSKPAFKGVTDNEKNSSFRRMSKVAMTTGSGASRSSLGMSNQVPYYDPIFSDDFFEIPYDLNVRRIWYMHFYQYNPMVGRCIDLYTNLTASDITLVLPKSQDPETSEFVLDFFQRMIDRTDFFGKLVEEIFEYWLYGNAFLFAQEGEGVEYLDFERPNFKDLKEKQAWYKEKVFGKLNPDYLGWEKFLVLPTNQVRVLSKEFSEEVKIQYIPAANVPSVGYGVTGQYMTSNLQYSRIQEEIPEELVEDMDESGVINMSTDPYRGSAVMHLARRKSGYLDYGISILDRVIKVLIYEDKLRQMQTVTVNRRKVPIRVVWADQIDENQLASLEQDVDLALMNPDFSIVANYEIHWEEYGIQDRILDLSSEYEECYRKISIALGLPMEIILGEGTYTGQKVSIDILAAELSLLRQELLKRLIVDFVFKPVAYKKGFLEIDKFGNEKLIYPGVKFGRPAILDTATLIDQMYNLYSKGSLAIDPILELLGVDPEENRQKLVKDFMTVNDARFHTMIERIADGIADKIVESTDIATRVIDHLGLKTPTMAAEEAGRFGEEAQ